MSSPRRPAPAAPSLDTCKRDAARLLKQVRAGDASAKARFDRLDNPPQAPQLKHALAVVAQEAGFAGWTDLKQAQAGLDFSEFFAAPGLGDTLNVWFNNYDEAQSFHAANGGVLLPYRQHAFVTSPALLDRLGFEAGHADWAAIGYDFVRPASPEAHARIKAALERRFGQKG
jgi:hypothetical protein